MCTYSTIEIMENACLRKLHLWLLKDILGCHCLDHIECYYFDYCVLFSISDKFNFYDSRFFFVFH